MISERACHKGSDNVYADLGFPNAEEMQAKAILVSRIISIIEKNNWNQQDAAKALKISQPKISLLSRGQFSGFSMEKLMALLNKLNQDVDIVIRNRTHSRKGKGHINVIYAAI